MKKLNITFTEVLVPSASLQHISDTLDQLNKSPIEEIPWPVDYKPKVNFALAHNSNCFYIKFYVEEQFVRATYNNSNDPVYKDSCVEVFMAFNGEKGYYNFEFNCLGTCLAGYGTGRNDRERIPNSVINHIKRLATIETVHNVTTENKWQLTLAMPLKIFYKHNLTSLKGLKSKANFYKCGDDLPQPHYLAWNNIKAPQPNFHLPEFFGEMQFA